MALDYQQSTPPAEVRFIEDRNKAKATGPQKAPEVASIQRAPAQARAEIRTTQQQVVRTKEKVIAIISQTDTSINPRARATQGFTTKSNSRRPTHSVETKAAHPKSYVRNRASDDAFVNPNINPKDADKKVENLDEVLGATVNSPAIARRKAKEALVAMEKPDLALKKNEKAKRVKPLPIINSDELMASIRAINALTSAIEPSDAEDIESEDKQLQAAADAYDEQELADLIKKYPDSMRKKRAKIVATPEIGITTATNPEELIASIREILALVQAKNAKKIVKSASRATSDEELSKPQDVLAGMNDMDNYLERAFSAMLNDQPDVADNALASLARNFQFQPLK